MSETPHAAPQNTVRETMTKPMVTTIQTAMARTLGCVGILCLNAFAMLAPAAAQTSSQTYDAFAPIDHLLPTPNAFRTAAGYPGPSYWQQRADYDIAVTLDDDARLLNGELTLTYTNNSPDTLDFIWVHLDQNSFADDGHFQAIQTTDFFTRRGQGMVGDDLPIHELKRQHSFADNQYGMTVSAVTGPNGASLDHIINGTLMRVALPSPIATGDTTAITIAWSHPLLDTVAIGSRSGWEELEDGTLIVGAALWFPRVAAYTDYEGWHVDQFLGAGEFTLEFGDYTVAITVPDNHIVAATGSLANATNVLTPAQITRFEQAATADRPVLVVTKDEADRNRRARGRGTKTWIFEAENVRDFAWASSPSFMWDALGVAQDIEDFDAPETVMAMSFFPDEGDPLWGLYATEAIAHTLEVYSAFTFPYPYPTAQAVNGPKTVGMEYPMISFDGVRPENVIVNGERTYSAGAKYGLIGLIIHETGHFYFPMVVNSAERRWMWMDEGLNTFLESIANMTFETGFPDSVRNRSGLNARFKSDVRPLMTTADSQTGVTRGNAYIKTTTSLHILRELVLGRENFDRAFKAYARAWMFKRAEPGDFFRAMETEAGEDLDWFWRQWFYTTQYVDVSIDDVTQFQIAIGDPRVEQPLARQAAEDNTLYLSFEDRNDAEGIIARADRRPHLQDFYTQNDRYTVSPAAIEKFEKRMDGLSDLDRAAMERAAEEGKYIHQVTFTNLGGAITPLPLTFTFADGTTTSEVVSVYVWRREDTTVSKLFIHDQPLVSVQFDPEHMTADADTSNNIFPRPIRAERLTVNIPSGGRTNLMKEMAEAE